MEMDRTMQEKWSRYLTIFLILQPLFDFLTGIGLHVFQINVTFGMLVRMLFLLFIMFTTVFVYKKKKLFFLYLGIFLYFILYLIGIVSGQGTAFLFSEIQGFLRVFYFPILLISLYSIKDQIQISKMTWIVTLSLYLILILIPILFHVGYQSYQITKAGTLGFFNSANEISGIISLFTPMLFLLLEKKRTWIWALILFLIYFIVILTVGTKTPLLSFGITVFFLFLYFTWKWIKEKKYHRIGWMLLPIVVVGILIISVLPRTNFYKNIQTHLDYLELDHISEVFQEKELIDHFIFSQRLTFLEDRHESYMEAPMIQKLAGTGYTDGTETYKMVEMDYFDIYYSHGLIGFLLFFGIYGYVVVQIFRSIKKVTWEMYLTMISFFFVVILSLFTGHMITAPAVSIFVVFLLLSLDQNRKKRLFFTSYYLDIGGIETALVELLKRIDTTENEVTLLLEKKEGIFLDQIPKEIVVKEWKVYEDSFVILRKIKNLLKRGWFSLLYYHTYDFSCCYATYSLSGGRLALLASRNNAIYVHSNYQWIYEKKEYHQFFDERRISEFQHIIFVSKGARIFFGKEYPHLKEKTMVLNNFVDVDRIQRCSLEKVDIKKQKGKILFVFVGRLEEASKKISRILLLVRQIPEIELWMIGDGPDRFSYEKQVEKYKIEKRVRFLGKQSNPYPYMKEADYFILTSDYEGFPVVSLEAIVLKKPLISTIDVGDDQIELKRDVATMVSKDPEKMVKEVKAILKQERKIPQLDLNQIQEKRMKELQKLWR